MRNICDNKVFSCLFVIFSRESFFMKKNICLMVLCLLGAAIKVQAQANAIKGAPTRQDTLKGSNTPERAWWKAVRYDLTVRPDYHLQTISGNNRITYKVIRINHTSAMQLDLQAPLHIDSISQRHKRLSFRQDGNAWFVQIPSANDKALHSLIVYYSGKPKVSVNPPWDGGMIWTADSLGRPWMSVACQLSGASTWYPCKTYVGDKPDSGASIRVIVPDTLAAIANGRLESIKHNPDKTTSYTWKVLNPINNYGLTFYIGKYVHVPDGYPGEKGRLDMDFWVLDYNQPRVTAYLVPEVHQTFRTFEHWFGPYPFYEDSFKMVEAPYIGMEHQSAVGYGNHFAHGRYKAKRLTVWDMKTDRMVVHENAHEWFGNSITAKDPADRWLQEGFAGFAEELAIEDRYGRAAGEAFFLDRSIGRIGNKKPVIGRYGIFEDGGDDMYMKGWVLIHMIRAMMHNDIKFRALLRGLSFTFYHQSVTTAQIENYMSRHSGIDLRKIFDQYLRTVQVPVLEYRLDAGLLYYRFSNCVQGFSMPITINIAKDQAIVPDTHWQQSRTHIMSPADTLKVSPDFYVQTKKVQ
jgi:aminopeptidase N